jgi:hypothetical protein
VADPKNLEELPQVLRPCRECIRVLGVYCEQHTPYAPDEVRAGTDTWAIADDMLARVQATADELVRLRGENKQLIEALAARPEPTELERKIRERVAGLERTFGRRAIRDYDTDLLLRAADALAAHHIRMVLLGPLVEQRDAARSTMQRVAREMGTARNCCEVNRDQWQELSREWTRILGGGDTE